MVTVVTSHNGHNRLRTQVTQVTNQAGTAELRQLLPLEHHERTELYPLLGRKARCTVSLVRYVNLLFYFNGCAVVLDN